MRHKNNERAAEEKTIVPRFMIPVLINDTPVDCINQAAIIYHIPATLILSILKKENGRNGKVNVNRNGTHDYGIMQINDAWLPTLAAYGYTKEDLQFNACKNVIVGAWIISQKIAKGDNIWQSIGNYHSKTKFYNQSYRESVQKNYRQLSKMLRIR